MVHALIRGVLTLLTVIGSDAYAGTVEQAYVTADPQMQVKKGAIQGCGYRLMSIPMSAVPGQGDVVMLDASFNVYSNALSLLKAGVVRMKSKNGAVGQTINMPLEGFWLKVPDKKPTSPLNDKYVTAETPGYMLAGTDITYVMALFDAVWNAKPITVGVRVRGEPIDRIYVGVPQLSAEDRAQGQQCVDHLVDQMQTETDKEQKPAR